MMSDKPLLSPDSTTWLHTLKNRIQSARISAARAANRELILLYWDKGRVIVEKQQALGWGKTVVERLSADLQAVFPGLKGFSVNNLWLMRQFYTEYSASVVFASAPPEAGLLEGSDLEHTVQDPADRDQGRGASHPRIGMDSLMLSFRYPSYQSLPWDCHRHPVSGS
jgi:hypothetical protein